MRTCADGSTRKLPFYALYLQGDARGANRRTLIVRRDQRVTLETSSQPVRIVGITPDHGLLRTVPINVDRMGNEVFGGGASMAGQPQYIDLQPDGNRFDLMKGMLYAR